MVGLGLVQRQSRSRRRRRNNDDRNRACDHWYLRDNRRDIDRHDYDRDQHDRNEHHWYEQQRDIDDRHVLNGIVLQFG